MLRPQVAPLAGQVEKLLRQRLGAVDLALRDEYLADTDQRAHLAERVPEAPTQAEAFLESLECGHVVSDGEEGPAECVETGSEFRDVSELSPEGDAFAEQGAALVGITLPAREPAGSNERRRADRAAGVRAGKRVGQSSSSFGEMGVRHPEPTQGARELELSIRVVKCEPLEGGTKVIVIRFEALRVLGFRVYAPCVTLGGEGAKGGCVTSPE